MKLFRLIVPSLAGLLLAFSTLVAFARATPAPASPPPPRASETALLPSGDAEDIHADAAGKLWITEIDSATVREFDPATRAYTLYTGLVGGPRDAQLGPDGKLWFLESNPQAVARMDLSSRIVTTWPVTTSYAAALAFDSSNRIWFVDEVLAGVYRFDPNGNQYCDFALPGGNGGPFISANNGALWLGDTVSDTLGRITPTSGAYTYWPLNFSGFALPSGVTFAPNGDVYWADRSRGKVGRLEPAANRLTLYGPPGTLAPIQVAYQAGKVWFTDPFTASLGYIDTALATGTEQHTAAPITTLLVPDCDNVGSGFTSTASISTGVASFSPVVLTTTVDVDSEGTLFRVPDGGQPWGLVATRFGLWATDVGRDKLMQLDTARRLYLPLARR